MKNTTKDTVIAATLWTLFVVLMLGAVFGGWYAKRWWNNTMFYDDATRATVCEMVKPESLKDGVCE